MVKYQHFTLATGLWIHCIGLCFWLFSTWRVNTWTSWSPDSPVEEATPWDKHICRTHSEPHPPSGCLDVCQHGPPHPCHPPSPSPFCPGPKGWEGEIWRFDQRAKENCWFFSHISLTAASPHSFFFLCVCITVPVYVFTVNIPCAYKTSLCV